MTEKRHKSNRHIIKRIIVRGTLVLKTPTCLGNGDADSPTDLPLLRDSISNHALLTGSSIAGALRNYLRERNKGYNISDRRHEIVAQLFGDLMAYEHEKHLTEAEKIERRSQDTQSPLMIDDALSKAPIQAELRDGVKINSVTRTAEAKKKYDLELLQAGTTFPLCLELLIVREDQEITLVKALAIETLIQESHSFPTLLFKWLAQQGENEIKLIKSLALALQGLAKGEIHLGMKKRRGFGRCNVKAWQVWEFDLTQDEKRLEWLLFEHWCTELSPEHETYSSIATAFGVSLDEEEDRRDRFFLEAKFTLASPLLIRSGQDSTGCAPDVVHLRSHRDGELKPVLSGTSLAGVLRHRAERIVNTLDKSKKIVNDVFGFVEENSKQAQASRLVVHESVIENTDDLVQNRIAIDRFTGGAYHGALFSEQPIFGTDETHLTLELELRQPRKAEIGLLLLLLKDLWTSDLPVGGESSIGRGRLQGIQAKMRRQIPGKATQTWTISQDGEHLQVSDANTLEAFVNDFFEEVIE
ncbi:RAMP superfamily CRISPR-associated protein [Coleofasciculus sp.]|uniref:RAMP superfamily CRISPR-associated protein n=1 Tax=Coleofasciculus sp. TaxID=3100458 RepID=UPI003A4431EA